jgi:iron complex transport system permease protein
MSCGNSKEFQKKLKNLYNNEDSADSVTIRTYKSFIKFKKLFLIFSFLLLIIIMLIALNTGALPISFEEMISYLFRFERTGMGRVIWDVRLVRVVGAILAGVGLAVSGVVMQCILKNPLASPYTLGLSSAAAFGASFAILFLQVGTRVSSSTMVINNPYIVTISAFIFSMLATGIILLLTKVTSVSAESMVLAGIAMNAIFSSGLMLMQYMADSVQLANMVTWSFGDIGRANWTWNVFIFIVLIPVATYFIYNRWNYNAMDSGEQTARGLGINPEAIRITGMVLSSLLCSIIVSFFGIIAFIGLLGPHISRMIIGGDHRYLIPAAMINGSIILLLSDTAAKTLLAPVVLPVGILTSLLGGPLFIFLLIRRPRR